MKKTLLLTAMLGLASTGVQADALALKFGGQGWLASAESGSFEADETSVAVWAAFEHPIPIIPNVKVRAYNFDSADNSLVLETADYLLYYELLDNPAITLDLGIGAHHIRSGEIGGVEFEGALPEVYAATRIPFFDRDEGLGFYAEGVAASLSDIKMTDIQAGLSYSFSLSAIDLHLMAGYRFTSYEYDGFDDLITADQDFDGATLGFEFDI
ncbi:TIGR04219 family outer membrane beta-barrel protein [Umboniibacter marinipuniceus]|uniref:Outer membrane protein n=1 Tax=Umboniibacter marinipuniceus TaxID=569599 RepID=A0A3M0A6G0_9GAMM|nr:TIGR04219 family outer membrane beta-barrel protein [Umboniibacter marinipuniceus]RMA80177.1 outer membrane protein [Umboniibacter marinipuniceus]